MMPSRIGSEANDERRGGFALLMVLLFLLVVASVLTSLVLAARTDLLIASNKFRQDRLAILAEGLVTALAREIASPASEIRNPAISFRSAPMRCQIGTLRIEARIQDQFGLADLNTAGAGLLEAGFVALGLDRGKSASLAATVIAFRRPPGTGGESSDIDTTMIAGGLKEGPFEAVEELYDFRDLRNMPARQIVETFTIYGHRQTILGSRMPSRLAKVLPDAPTGRYPFVSEGSDESSPESGSYRIDVSVRMANNPVTGFAGSVILATGNDAGDFEVIERMTNPDFLPQADTGFSGAIDCEILFGDGVAAALRAIES